MYGTSRELQGRWASCTVQESVLTTVHTTASLYIQHSVSPTRGQNSDRGSVRLPQRFFIGLGHSCGGKIAIGGVFFCLRGFS